MIARVVYYFIEVIEIAMLVRAVISWIPLDEDNPVETFVTAITEPFIYPVRLIVDRIDALRNCPLDISFFVAYLILFLLSSLLSRYGGI